MFGGLVMNLFWGRGVLNEFNNCKKDVWTALLTDRLTHVQSAAGVIDSSTKETQFCEFRENLGSQHMRKLTYSTETISLFEVA